MPNRREFLVRSAATASSVVLLRSSFGEDAAAGAAIWTEDFEGDSMLDKRGWASEWAGISTVSAHGGKQALWLSKPGPASWAKKLIGEKLKIVWIDAYLQGSGVVLSIVDANGKPVLLSSHEQGFFSASEIYAHRRINSDVKIDEEKWRRVSVKLDVERGRWDFYLNDECVFRELLVIEGSAPASALSLRLEGAGFADDIAASVEPPKGIKPAPTWLPPKPKDCLLRVAQISDTHLEKSGKFLDETRRVLADLVVMNPDLVIHTGDVCDNGDEAGHEKFKELSSVLKMPVHCIRGNHELMKNGAAGFEKVFGKKEQVVDVNGVRFVLTDNATDGANGPDHMGVYTDEQVAWIAQSLEKWTGPVVMAGHVPLVKTEKAWFVVKNQDKLLALIKKYRVLGYMCGHLHRPDNASVVDGFIHGVAMPASGAYTPPAARCKGYAIWDVFKDRAVMYHAPLYSAFRPQEGFKGGGA